MDYVAVALNSNFTECSLTNDNLIDFYGGFFNEWYGNDYTEDFKTCFKPSDSLRTATCDYITNLAKADQDSVASGVIEMFNEAAHYDVYFGDCKNAESDMGEAKGWYDQWHAKGDEDIKKECNQDIGIAYEMGT